MRVSVEVGFLRTIVAPLRQSVEAARRWSQDAGQLKGYAGASGSGEIEAAGAELVDRWGAALTQIADDAEQVAAGLEQSATAYHQTEQAVAGAVGRLATAPAAEEQHP